MMKMSVEKLNDLSKQGSLQMPGLTSNQSMPVNLRTSPVLPIGKGRRLLPMSVIDNQSAKERGGSPLSRALLKWFKQRLGNSRVL